MRLQQSIISEPEPELDMLIIETKDKPPDFRCLVC